MIGLEKSFQMMFSNIGLGFRWTLPLMQKKMTVFFDDFIFYLI